MGVTRRRCLQDGWSALVWAAQEGHAEVATALLEAGADVEARTKVRCRGGLPFLCNLWALCGFEAEAACLPHLLLFRTSQRLLSS